MSFVGQRNTQYGTLYRTLSYFKHVDQSNGECLRLYVSTSFKRKNHQNRFTQSKVLRLDIKIQSD